MLLENIEEIDISLFIILKKLNLDGGCRMEKIEIAALSQIADILSDSEKSPIAVSYTHLDVYKRQLHKRLILLWCKRVDNLCILIIIRNQIHIVLGFPTHYHILQWIECDVLL